MRLVIGNLPKASCREISALLPLMQQIGSIKATVSTARGSSLHAPLHKRPFEKLVKNYKKQGTTGAAYTEKGTQRIEPTKLRCFKLSNWLVLIVR